MNTTLTSFATALALLLAVAAKAAAEITVKADKENIVASRLAGTWEVDKPLTERLGGRAGAEIIFKCDPAVAKLIPAKYEPFLKDKQVYLAGTMSAEMTEGKAKLAPFILIEMRGNPHVVWFRERDGDPLGDAESFNVMLGVAKDAANDVLLIGGDFNNQPMSAYRRRNTIDNR